MEPNEGSIISSTLEDTEEHTFYESHSDSPDTSVNTLFSSRQSSLRPSHDDKQQVATLCYVYSNEDLQVSSASEDDMLRQPNEILAVGDSLKIELQSIDKPPSSSSNVVGVVSGSVPDTTHKQQLGWTMSPIPNQSKAQLLSISEEEVPSDSNYKLQSGWSPPDTEEKVTRGESKREPPQSSNDKEFHNDAKWYRKTHMRAQSLYHRAMLLKTKVRSSSYDLPRADKDQLDLGTPFSIGSTITDRSVTFPIPRTTNVLKVPSDLHPDSFDTEALHVQNQRSFSPQSHAEDLETLNEEFEEDENEEITLEDYLTMVHKRLSSRMSKSPVSTTQPPYSAGTAAETVDDFPTYIDYMSGNPKDGISPHLIEDILGFVEPVSSVELQQGSSATFESSVQTLTNLSQSPSTILTPEFYKERHSDSTTLGMDSRKLSEYQITRNKQLSDHVLMDNRPPSIVHREDETVMPIPPHAAFKPITDDTSEHLTPIDHPHENLSTDIAYQQYYRPQASDFLKNSISTQSPNLRETVRPNTARILDIQAAKLSLDRAMDDVKLSDVINSDTEELQRRKRLRKKITDSRSTGPIEQSYSGILENEGGVTRNEVYDFRSSKDVKKLEMIKIRAKKWMAKAKQQEQVKIIAAQQGRRALVETPRAIKQVIWKEAYLSVNKAYELYKSSLGSDDMLTQGALNHLMKLNEYA